MSDPAIEGLKPPTPEEINKLRHELRSLKSEDLDDDTIEEILRLPPTLFFEAVHGLTLVFGSLSTFPATTTPHDKSPSTRPNPVSDGGESLLQNALDALTRYNDLLEEKVSKFNIQSTRSLATVRESLDSDHDITPIIERAEEIRRRNEQLKLQIDSMRNSFDTHDENNSLRLEEYTSAFWSEALFLSSNEFFDSLPPPSSAETPLWHEYDYILQHVQRWRSLVDFHSSHESEATISHARQLVNALVYTITRHCQVQLETVFFQNSSSRVKTSDYEDAALVEAADIVKEIDWLWEEVIPVAHMSVSAQFLRPIVKLYKDWESSKQLRMAIVTTYASGVLRFMNDRLNAVAERTKILVYHYQALHNFASICQLKEATGSESIVPNVMLQAAAHKSRLGPEQAMAAEQVRSYMQLYGVAPIHVDDPSPKPTPSVLDEYVQNRAHKGDTLLQDLHKLFEAAAKSDLTDRELGGELLLESLLADSATHPAKPGSVYMDTQLEGSIEVLQDQVNQIQGMFKDLKFEGPAAAADYVAHAYRQIAGRPAAKVSEGGLKGGQNPKIECADRIRSSKFEEFVRKWGS
ncbi:hypothetical protein F5Y09DRAFT_309700 [Xylaria sp. FL1042]|nr:hypothetical protein F5Y09DRAFT_309700 [Xylaria sp. FL1042]